MGLRLYARPRSAAQSRAADPTYPLAHAALSEVWDRLDYTAKAKAEAERALQLSEHLSQEERLLVEGQYRTVIEDRPKAVAAYQALFDLFPDNLEYGLRLASAQRWVNRQDSLRTRIFFVIFLLLLAKIRAIRSGARHPPGSTRTSKKGTLPRSAPSRKAPLRGITPACGSRVRNPLPNKAPTEEHQSRTPWPPAKTHGGGLPQQETVMVKLEQ